MTDDEYLQSLLNQQSGGTPDQRQPIEQPAPQQPVSQPTGYRPSVPRPSRNQMSNEDYLRSIAQSDPNEENKFDVSNAEGQYDSSIGAWDLTKARWKNVGDAALAAAVEGTPESNYANRLAKKSYDEMKSLQSRATPSSRILAGAAGIVPALAATYITKNPVIGASLMGIEATGESLSEQSGTGETPSMNKALLAGAGTTAANLALGKFGEKILGLKPNLASVAPKREFALRTGVAAAEDSLTAGLEQSFINMSAGKDPMENVGEAMTSGVVGGAATRGGFKIVGGVKNRMNKYNKAYDKGGVDGVREEFRSETPDNVNLNQEFVDTAIQSDVNLASSQSKVRSMDFDTPKAERNKIIDEAIDTSNKSDASSVADVLRLMKDNDFTATPAAYEAKLRSKSGLGDQTVGEMTFGIKPIEGEMAREAHENAIRGFFSKLDYEQGFTTGKFLKNNQTAWDKMEGQFNGVYSKNSEILDKWVRDEVDAGRLTKSPEFDKDIAKIHKSLKNLAKLSETAAVQKGKDVTADINSEVRKLYELDADYKFMDQFVNEFGDKGGWDPIRTSNNYKTAFDMVYSQHKNIEYGSGREKTQHVDINASSADATSIIGAAEKIVKMSVGGQRNRDLLRKYAAKSKGHAEELLKVLRSGDHVKAAEMTGADLSSKDLVNTKPKSERPVKGTEAEPSPEVKAEEPEVTVKPEEPEVKPEPEVKSEEPKAKDGAPPPLRKSPPKKMPTTEDVEEGISLQSQRIQTKKDNELRAKAIGYSEDPKILKKREDFLAELGHIDGLRKRAARVNQDPLDYYNSQYKERVEKVETDNRRLAEAERHEKQRELDAEQQKADMEDSLRASARTAEVNDEYIAKAREEIMGGKGDLTSTRITQIVKLASKRAQKDAKVKLEEDNKALAEKELELKKAEEANTFASQEAEIKKALDAVKSGGMEFEKARAFAENLISKKTPLKVNEFDKAMEKIQVALEGEIARQRGLYNQKTKPEEYAKANAEADRLTSELKRSQSYIDAMNEKIAKQAEVASEVEKLKQKVEAEKLKSAKEVGAIQQKLDNSLSQIEAVEYARKTAGVIPPKHIFDKSKVNGKVDLEKFKANYDKWHSDMVREKAEKIEPKMRETTVDDVQNIAGDLIYADSRYSGPISMEVQAEMEAAIKRAGKLNDEKTKKLLTKYIEIVKRSEAIKAEFPSLEHRNLWMSRNDSSDIMNIMGTTTGSSYGGSVLPNLRAKIFDTSKDQFGTWTRSKIDTEIKSLRETGEYTEWGKDQIKRSSSGYKPESAPKPEPEPTPKAESAESAPETKATPTEEVKQGPLAGEAPKPKSEEPKVEPEKKGPLAGEEPKTKPKSKPKSKYSAPAKAVKVLTGKTFGEGRPLKEMNADMEGFKQKAVDAIAAKAKGAWPVELESYINKMGKKRSKADFKKMIDGLNELLDKLV